MSQPEAQKEPPNEYDQIWINLFDSLASFITSATSLTENLQKAVDVSQSCISATASENSSSVSSAYKTADSGHEGDAELSSREFSCPQSCRSKSSVKSSKGKELKKQKQEALERAKSEKLCKLKDNLLNAQENLKTIQEEIRQLERLYTDYDNFNTTDGKVNPAALYKEIMKPQVIPRMLSGSVEVTWCDNSNCTGGKK